MDNGSPNIQSIELSDQSLETDGGVCESLIEIQPDDDDFAYFSAPRPEGILCKLEDPSIVHSQPSSDQEVEPQQARQCFIASFQQSEQATEIIKEENESEQSSARSQTPLFSSISVANHSETGFHDSYHISDTKVQKMLQGDEDGDTQLHMAIIQNLVSVAVYIIRCLSAVNSDLLNIQNNNLQTPLWLAVYEQHLDVVETLIENGASLSVVDINGNTPLHIACNYGFDDIVYFLLENVERETVKKCISFPNYGGQLCIHLAADRMHLSVMRLLLKHGADVNDREKLYGMTILHKAAETGNMPLLEYILNLQGLDLHLETYNGSTAILLAYVENQPDIVRLLRQVGPNL